MELGNLIDTLQAGGGEEKTASANAFEDNSTEKALEAALEKVAASAPAETRTSGNPGDELMKMAADLAGVEKEAEIQHAALLGQAFADAAIGTWQAYDADMRKHASETTANTNELVKSAALQGYYDTINAIQSGVPQMGTEKMASNDEIEELIKQAEAEGYSREEAVQAIQELSTKTAEEQVEMGQKLALDELYSTAYNEFLKGAANAQQILASVK